MDNITNERYYDYMMRRSREEDAKMAQDNVINKAARSIWVTFRKEGVPMYPGADSDPKLATGDWDDVLPVFPPPIFTGCVSRCSQR